MWQSFEMLVQRHLRKLVGNGVVFFGELSWFDPPDEVAESLMKFKTAG